MFSNLEKGCGEDLGRVGGFTDVFLLGCNCNGDVHRALYEPTRSAQNEREKSVGLMLFNPSSEKIGAERRRRV